MKRMKRLAALLGCFLILIPLAATAEDGFSTSYTYTYDFWEDSQASPDAYRVATVIDSMTLGLDNLEGVRINKPQALYAREISSISATRATTGFLKSSGERATPSR